MDDPPDLPHLWPEPWAGEAFAQQAHVKAQMAVAYETQNPDPRRAAARSAIEKLLASVRAAVTREEIPRRRTGRLRKKRRLADIWRGKSVEWAYSHLHAAKTVLVELLPMEDVMH